MEYGRDSIEGNVSQLEGNSSMRGRMYVSVSYTYLTYHMIRYLAM